MVKIDKHPGNVKVQVDSSSYEIQTFTVGRMQIMIYAGEMVHFCHSFTLGEQMV